MAATTKTNKMRAGNIAGDVAGSQPDKGGSIPTPALFFHLDMYEEANELVKKHHYSGRPVTARVVGTLHESGGLFGNRGGAVAACVIANSPAKWSEDVLELLRLVRTPECTHQLSQLIGWTISAARKKTGCGLFVSFADSTQGHHGGVYQAAGWKYNGQRSPAMDGVVVDGIFIPGRSAVSRFGTRSPQRLLERGIIAEPHYDTGKHLYWRALTRRANHAASRLGLKSTPYPKPARAETGGEGAQ